MKRNGLIAALDIGTSKVCCFLARSDGHGGARVVGIGHQVAKGMRAGGVTDMEQVEASVRSAVEAAERMAEERIEDVYVALGGAEPESRIVGVEVATAGQQVAEADLRRVMGAARERCLPSDGEIVHAIPTGYTIDGSRGIRDPRGMYGEQLGVALHMVTSPTGPLRNLRLVTERCHLETADFVLTPYASGLAVLVEDEVDLGATVIDMGAGTTSIAVFYDGALIFFDVVGVGGAQVTKDLAWGLSTSTQHAERIKTLYGSAIASPADEREMIVVPQVGEEESLSAPQVPRSMLAGIIQPRVEETFELVRERLEGSGLAHLAGRRCVLTGGASQLTGVPELAARVLDKQVRPGRPLRIQGLAEATGGPAFAACAGLLAYAFRPPTEARVALSTPGINHRSGRLARLGRWLRESL